MKKTEPPEAIPGLSAVRDDDGAGQDRTPAFERAICPWRGSRLKAGRLAAHVRFRLMLLGSPPDMVHEFTLRETGSSTLLTGY